MKEADIRKYAALMKELELTALEISEDNKRVRLERSLPGALHEPMVIQAAPAENAEPFVAIGDRVEKGQTLCIIEAMKLMNEIAAEESGVIEKICVTNGQVVEYGTELFRIRR